MKTIINFFTEFIKLEADAETKRLLPDLEQYNKAIIKLKPYVTPQMEIKLGIRVMTEPEDESFYEIAKEMEAIRPRYLFRIDKVKGKNKQSYYMAYVSELTSSKSYFHCLVATDTDGSLHIVTRFTFGIGRDGSKIKHWYNSGGEPLEFKDLQNIIDTVRFLPPEDDEASMKQYLA